MTMTSSQIPAAPRRRRRLTLGAIAVASIVATVAGCASANDTPAANSGSASSAGFTEAKQVAGSPITVWTDSTRLPDVQQYAKENPGVKLNIVTFDGSADGSTYLQTKVQLFDRTGKGWPDVVFASPTDVTWASAPTNPSAQPFAAPVDKLVPSSVLSGFATGSLAPCHAGGHN